MTKHIGRLLFAAGVLLTLASCEEASYDLGDLTPPSNIQITAQVVGATSATPNGNGTGDVNFTVTADGALAYKIDYDASDGLTLVNLPTGKGSKKYTKLGTNTYTVTAVVYGPGGTSSTATSQVTVISTFQPDASIPQNLTAGTSKTWIVDKSVPGHFGVGPWNDNSPGPEWWSASVNEKVACCNCFYTTTFTFTKTASGYTLTIVAPDGAFTKTGALAGGLPGIPASGDEGCYATYTGGTSSFSFIPSGTGIPASTPSTKTTIQLSGSSTFIGYGATQKDYEIMSLTENTMYLRVQGTETGNAWYLRMIPKP
ncbi:MAG: hypothetical protein H6555_11275 [Lewinellaceae bacterium]|nr:hypothetical protein [Lewinellaceae bacterium]